MSINKKIKIIKNIYTVSKCGNIKMRYKCIYNLIHIRYINNSTNYNSNKITENTPLTVLEPEYKVTTSTKKPTNKKTFIAIEKESSSLDLEGKKRIINNEWEKEINTLILPYNINDYSLDLLYTKDIKNINDILLLRKNILPEEIKKHMENKWNWVYNINYNYNSPTYIKKEIWVNIDIKDKNLYKKPNAIEFYLWLIGFTDAEGNFQIQERENRFTFSYRIKLHQDDVGVLLKIQENLGVGNIYSNFNGLKRTYEFTVQSTSDIIEKIIPIFDMFPLLTSKALKYKYFREAIEIKKNVGINSTLSNTEYKKILDLRKKMDLSPQDIENWNNHNIKYGVVTSYWLTGFVEGDGSFVLSNLKPSFYIGQKNINNSTIYLIYNYLKDLYINNQLDGNWEKNIPLVFPPLPLNVKNWLDTSKLIKDLNTKRAYSSLSISNINALYFFVLPFFINQKFYSRKEIDFKLWVVALLLHYRNLSHTKEGHLILHSILNNINDSRYSTYIKQDTEKIYDPIELSKINNIMNNLGDNSKSIKFHSIKALYLFKDKKYIQKFETITKGWEFLKFQENYPYSRITFSKNNNSFISWKNFNWFSDLTLLDKNYQYPSNILNENQWESTPKSSNISATWITKNSNLISNSPFTSLKEAHKYMIKLGYPYTESTFIKKKNQGIWIDMEDNIYRWFNYDPSLI